MITPITKNEGKTVIFGPCRLSYTHLFRKYVKDGEDESKAKYMTNVLIPKEEKETIDALNAAIEAAKKSGVVSKWDGKEPKKLDLPLRDGDDKEDDDDIYGGNLYLNAKCTNRPGVVDKHRSPIMDEDDVYSGMWAILSVTFFPYNVSGNKGVACGLNNVMKTKDDERLGGRTSAESDFAGIDMEDDDDL
ncbi:DUF2815 family protein [uncultured Prevotella sp.]|uniref:DUF2815 family protein n=1 Tax=uncultured Prevotella sp. TaxID=159272 RepID=UPI002606D58B|nr:DUF2815 family protein [uncultured Prevotella sp.]